MDVSLPADLVVLTSFILNSRSPLFLNPTWSSPYTLRALVYFVPADHKVK
jgi:hypothetical protein